MLYLRGLSLRDRDFCGEDAYLAGIPAVATLSSLAFTSPVACFVGENGSGKSTLLEAVAVAFGFNPEGGSRNLRFSTMDSHSGLYRHLTLVRGAKRPSDGYFLRAESFYNVATALDRLDEEASFGPPLRLSYGGKSLHERSHGESFWTLITERFGGQGLYLMDEPEAALSPQRQLALLREMKRLVDEGSQFLLSTHSPLLTAYPGADLFELSEKGIAKTSYDALEPVALTRAFLKDPAHMLRLLEVE